MEVITTHVNAEFDGFASMVAARHLYPGAVPVFPGAQEKNLRLFLDNFPHHQRFRRMRSLASSGIERLIVVDTRRADRIGRLAQLAERPGVDVHVYDHHPPSPQDLPSSHAVVEEVGATTTLMVEQLRQRGLRITPLEATIYGLGIYEDTGSLTFSSTTPRDLRAAAYLLECGLDLRVVSDYIAREMTPEQVSLLDDLLSSRTMVEVAGIQVAIATASRERFVGDLALIAHKMKDIENLNVLFVLVRMDDRIHLVARSRLDAVDVGAVTADLGGGGHATAASAVVRETDLARVAERLREVLHRRVRRLADAGELMSIAPQRVSSGTTVAEAHQLIGRFTLDHLPVVEGERLVGIIDRGAVERAFRHGLGGSPLADFMATDFAVLAPDDPFPLIRRLFLQRGQHYLPVVQGGRLLGAVTRADLLGILQEEEQLHPAFRGGSAGETYRPSRKVASLLEERLPPARISLIRDLAAVAGEEGFSAFLVGGFVRDLLLGLPNDDLDLCVEGDGIAFARRLVARLGGRLRSHPRFETAVVVLPDGYRLDVATSRMEYYLEPGSPPVVEHGPIKMDLYRRDFTINALAIRISGGEFGRVIDHFGGTRDLEEGAVRVLHGLSLVEDPSRIFRAVRFEQRLDFHIGANTLKLIGHARDGNLVSTLAAGRLWHELKEILTEEKAPQMLRRLGELDLLRTIHPALTRDEPDLPILENLQRAGREWRGEGGGTEGLRSHLFPLAFLTGGCTLEEITSLTERLGIADGPEGRLLMAIWIGHRRLAGLLSEPSLTPGSVLRLVEGHPPEVLVYTLGAYPGTPISRHLTSFLSQGRRLRPLLSGADLLREGYPPGVLYKEILGRLREAQLEGEVPDRRAALDWVRRRFPGRTSP